MATLSSDASNYDVFLSFQSSDTRYGFTGNLYEALVDKEIHTCFDEEESQRGDNITPELVKTIQESKIAIIVLSEHYAFSSFCLDELASILDCIKRERPLVLPVYYNVDFSHVRNQTGTYGEAFVKHEKEFKHNMEKLQKWKMALEQVTYLTGFHFKHGDGYEYDFIGRIVKRVCSEINHTPSHVDYPVGLDSKVVQLRKLLDVGCDGVIMIGICGTGGVGKSTLSREVYNSIADDFEASCFIENVREKSKKNGLQQLQSILLSNILGQDITLTSLQQGTSMIQRRLKRKKVLLILDNVDRQEQLEAVVGSPHWFGPGSRVIITTPDRQLLESHQVMKTYKVEKLSKEYALQLLTWNAFKKEKADPSYEEVMNRVLTYADGNPLALKVVGSNFCGKSVADWELAINQYEKTSSKIQDILKVTFDILQEEEKLVFLDIACYFNGYELKEVLDILGACYGFDVKNAIKVLVENSLVTLSRSIKPCFDTVTLHDLIEEMGKEIVRRSNMKPGQRSRFWLPEDIIPVLEKNTATSRMEMICLDFSIFDEEKKVEWDGDAFMYMKNLKTIIFRNINFSKGPEYLPNSLRVLEWWRYPSHCLPSDFHPKELVICKLPDSHILPTELSGLWKKFPNLKVLEFSSAND